MLNNAVLDHGYGDNAIGSIRRYTCDPRYLPIGQGKITIECFGEMTGENGIAIWGPPSDICHGRLSDQRNPFDTIVFCVTTSVITSHYVNVSVLIKYLQKTNVFTLIVISHRGLKA